MCGGFDNRLILFVSVYLVRFCGRKSHYCDLKSPKLWDVRLAGSFVSLLLVIETVFERARVPILGIKVEDSNSVIPISNPTGLVIFLCLSLLLEIYI